MPIMRYPGGNFVSGYNWLDGVGPKEQRPDGARARLEFARDEPVRHERVHRLVRAGRHRAAARHELRHRHRRDGGRLRRVLQRRRGHASGASSGGRTATTQPHNVRYWCLGNEMDGPWQIGHMPAREYGRKARDAARQMRVIDPNLQLIACGSSGTIMPTYLVWDREVLEECYDQVDGISLHAYYGNTPALSGNSTARYLAMNLDMERQIHEIAAVCDYVQGLQKSPQAAVAVVRRVERLVSRARRRVRRRPARRSRRSCSRRSTTSRTRCSSAASSTRCCAIPIACASPASRRSSTSSRRS